MVLSGSWSSRSPSNRTKRSASVCRSGLPGVSPRHDGRPVARGSGLEFLGRHHGALWPSVVDHAIERAHPFATAADLEEMSEFIASFRQKYANINLNTARI
jgi:hypothetical protein